MESSRLIEGAIGLVLAVYVIAAVGPGALNSIMGVNATTYSHWGTSATSLWGIMGIFVVISLVMIIYKAVKQ